MAKGSIIMRRLAVQPHSTSGTMLPSGVVLNIHPSNWKHRLSMKSVNFGEGGKYFLMRGELLDAIRLDPYRLTKITVSTEKFPYSTKFYIGKSGSLHNYSWLTLKGKSYNGPCTRFFEFVLGRKIDLTKPLYFRAVRINPTKEGD